MATGSYDNYAFSVGNVLDSIYSVQLDNDRIFLIYRVNAASNTSYCTIVKRTANNAITASRPVNFMGSYASDSTPMTDKIQDICKIDTDKVAIAFQDMSDSRKVKVIIATVSDMEITLGTAQQANTVTSLSNYFEVAICSPDTNKICLIYNMVTSAGPAIYNVYMRAGTVSGTVITFGTESNVATAIYLGIDIEKLSTDKVVITYIKDSIETPRYARARTITGTTLNALGTELIITGTGTNATSRGPIDVQNIATDKVGLLMMAKPTTSSDVISYTLLTYITASGTTLSIAYENIIKSTPSSALGFAQLSSMDYFIAHKESSLTSVLTQTANNILSVVETDIINSAEPEYGQISVATLDESTALLFYYDSNAVSGNIVLLSNPEIFSLQEKRNVVADLLVSWKKDFRSDIRFFSIGVSSIGGNDIIASNEAIDSQWNKYRYSDETSYLLSLDWEQSLNMPIGGISQGMASGALDNTTGRFTPRYLGGMSELFTAVLPRRPFIINAGFEDSGVEYADPQFVGLFTKQPEVDLRSKTLSWSGADFVNFLNNRYVDNTEMYTGLRSDQLIENILTGLGYGTSQYDLDTGINRIPFAIFNKGQTFGSIIHKIAQAENAQFYQDEEGILRFENRQHWDSSPYSDPQWELFTSQVINAKAPDTDHIINVVEVKAKIREKQPLQTIFQLATFSAIEVPANSSIEQFISFENPILSLTHPTNGGAYSFYKAFSNDDGTGTDLTSNITVTNLGTFAESVKYRFSNSSSSKAYITQLTLAGRAAIITNDLYYRAIDSSSVTAYEERPLVIENDYIHENDWANSFAQMVLNDFSEPENLQEITIMAIPSLKRGDLVSWQGRHWRVFTKKTRLDPGVGFIQDLTLLQRTIASYFRIGISTIGGSDKIAP